VLSICVYADPNEFKPIAIVVPVEASLRKFARMNGFAWDDTCLDSMVKDSSFVAAVHAEMLAVGKCSGLTRMELIQGLVLVTEEWTPENVLPTI
jgi:long-chain acyl-CoA synthetase